MVIKMRLSEFSNEEYQLLKCLKDIEIDWHNQRIIIDSQKEIASRFGISYVKLNSMMKHLCTLGIIQLLGPKGKYKITELGNKVIQNMEQEVK